MERRPFGNAKREVPVIGMGRWYIEEAERATAIAALRRGIDLGMTHVDTAEMYGSGSAEEAGAADLRLTEEIEQIDKAFPFRPWPGTLPTR